MFESTLPIDSAGLLRLDQYRHRRQLEQARGDAGSTLYASLNATLLDDLRRFESAGGAQDGLEALEVLAAAVRHGRSLLLQLQHQYRVIPLTVFPADGSVHCPVPMSRLLALELSELRVLQVAPAQLAPLGQGDGAGEPRDHAPIGPLLWELALRGARGTLLPEIAGRVAYRVPPGTALHLLGLSGSLAAAVGRLRRHSCNLNEIARWPGFDPERAQRLLNGLYLHAALMVSRTHPAAINDDHPSRAG